MIVVEGHVIEGPSEACWVAPYREDWAERTKRDIYYLTCRIRSLEAAKKRLEDSLTAPQRFADSIERIRLEMFPETPPNPHERKG